jgi:hypothetical protein
VSDVSIRASGLAKAAADGLYAPIASTRPKQVVRACATTQISLTAPGATLDGVTLTSGDRVLLVGQTAAAENGIYTFNGASSTMTRTTDANTATLLLGAFVFVSQGGTQGSTGWELTNTGTITVGTTALNWVQFDATVAPNSLGDLVVGAGNGAATVLPIGSTNQVATVSGGTVTWATPSTYQAPDIQVFTGNGTWTKPTGAKIVGVTIIGGGAGGGSGAQGATGTARCGGGGGGGGGLAFRQFSATVLGSTESVVVGAGGAGGAAQASTTTAGNGGTNGGTSSFGSHMRTQASGAGGGGGIGVAGSAGAASGSLVSGGSGAASSAVGSAGSGGNGAGAAPGGASGGGVNASETTGAGGAGASSNSSSFSGGTAGTAGGGAGVAGGSATANEPSPGGSGGGGGGAVGATAGGAGGAGGNYGAGGGGGGGSTNGASSGAGGAGANGIVVVITTF